tara:strand:- start:3317 stop:3784 length:468 start_codon:yes stop_codon:yes gene_type:complete
MKKTFVILIIYIFYGCNNHEIKKDKTTSSLDEKVTENISDNYFETISYDQKFEFVVDESIKGSNAVSCFGIGYHLLIGSTLNPNLPKKLSVLYHCLEPYDLKKGDTINIVPDKDQNFEDEIGIIYVASDTIINGKTETHILGSENIAIWADRMEL